MGKKFTRADGRVVEIPDGMVVSGVISAIMGTDDEPLVFKDNPTNPYDTIATMEAQLDMLLAACKAAHYKLVVAHGHDGGYGEHPDNPLPQQLRAAIAAVEGE